MIDQKIPDIEVFNALRLSELTDRITIAVNSHRELSNVWVTAELSDVHSSGGHCYMELVEKNASGQTVAKIRATIWQTTFRRIREKFFFATSREITTGLKVLVKGSATHHSIYGLSFNITDIDPSFTLGDIERIRREILRKLSAEGVIDNNKKLKMRPFPAKIAVISAPEAAGYGDFLNQLLNNEEGYSFYPYLFPAVMQGERVSESVRSQLDFIESTIDIWDAVVILRGGGSTSDLLGFDDYELARRIATFSIPVVVGIGHERDRTVLDEIACVRVKTPTAAASFFINIARESYNYIKGLADYVARFATEKTEGEKRYLSNLEIMIPTLSRTRISEAANSLNNYLSRISSLTVGRINHDRAALDAMVPLIENLAFSQIFRAKGKCEILTETCRNMVSSKLENQKLRLDKFHAMVSLLEPLNTLKRGYSIARINGKAIKNIKDAMPGEKMEIEIYNGRISSVIDKTEIR